MNKKLKILSLFFAVISIVGFSGCNNFKTKIEQQRCEHEMNEGEVTVKATCESVGEKTLTCVLCGYEEIEKIPAVGHIWNKVDEVIPTCTEVGYTDGVVCVTCHEYFVKPVEIPALGHIEVTDMGYSPTCTETGLTDGSHCAVCEEVLTAQEEIPENGHDFDVVVGKEPTCTEPGFIDKKVCADCGTFYYAQEEIPALGHIEVIDKGYSPTCSERGLTDGSHCAVCEEVLTAQEEIPMLLCEDKDGDGYCDLCDMILPLAEGTYTEVAVTVGETVAGYWYRFYYEEGYASNTIRLSTTVMDPYAPGQVMVNVVLGCLYGSEIGCTISSMTLGKFFTTQNAIMVTRFFDGYADIYIREGTLQQQNPDYGVVESEPVTAETTIEDIVGIVYRLQVNE